MMIKASYMVWAVKNHSPQLKMKNKEQAVSRVVRFLFNSK
jgi:hypothetical protein